MYADLFNKRKFTIRTLERKWMKLEVFCEKFKKGRIIIFKIFKETVRPPKKFTYSRRNKGKNICEESRRNKGRNIYEDSYEIEEERDNFLVGPRVSYRKLEGEVTGKHDIKGRKEVRRRKGGEC